MAAGRHQQFAEAAKKPFAGEIYYLDSAGYYSLVKNENTENLRSLIYGFFYKDSILKRPALLSRVVPACMQLMLEEMKESTAKDTPDDRKSEINNWLLTRHLRRLLDDSDYTDEAAGSGRTAVLLFSITLGRRFDAFYQQAVEIGRSAGYRIVILSLDPLYYKNEK